MTKSSKPHDADQGTGHVVGEPIQYFPHAGAAPEAGQILAVGGDGHTCDLVAWCSESGGYVEHNRVPHCHGGGATVPAGDFFLRPGEAHDHDHDHDHAQPAGES